MSTTPTPGLDICPVCTSKGTTSNLKLYQINEDEAIYMCTNEKCSYPIGCCDPALVIVKRVIPGLKDDSNDDIILDTVPIPNGGSGSVVESDTTHDNRDELDKEPTAKSELDIMLEGILSEDS